jgi:cytochrome c biogenesis protein CcmG, thiol:disulfide interchange protein DsbE
MIKQTLTTLAFAATFAATLGAAHATDAGQSAPAFDLPGTTGAVKLADLKGKVVYVDFWASWCGPCKQSFPWMNEMQSKYGAQGLQVVGITVDKKREDAEKFLAANPAKFAVAFDTAGDTPGKYAVKNMPTSYLIGADGKVVFVHGGFDDAAKVGLEAKIKQALGK